MPDHPEFKNKKVQPKVGLKPGQDFFTPKTPDNPFPTIGMTLPTYNKDSSKRAPNFGAHSFSPPKEDKKTKKDKKKRKITPKRVILILIVLILLVFGFLGFSLLKNVHKLFGGSLFGIFTSTTLKGESSGRVNILLAGNSADDPGHDGANLTDSIMLVSIDTKNNTAFLLSIPRDLWVNVPGYGYQKINSAYVDGQNNGFSAAGYPNGGMGQLEQVITQDLGIPIDYYGLIDYGGIRDAVDAVGGIQINIQSSDPRGLYDPSIDYTTHGPLVKLSNGIHTLDGQQALDLARARGDAPGSYGYSQSDFERTANQRAMLIALKQKATSAGVLSNPVKLNSLFNSVGSNVKTDLTISDVKELYNITKPITGKNTQSLSFQNINGTSLVTTYVTSGGQDALIPTAGIGNYSQMQHYVQQLISNNPIVKESAPVVILNGTNVTGLASKAESSLSSKGLNVVAVGDGPDTTSTVIIDNSAGKYPSTKAYLESVYGKTIVTNATYTADYPSASFIVILGENQVNQTSGSSTN
jgi:polyisoprenyl-teichoic acid--peptidoglycan teichoic acid transferase